MEKWEKHISLQNKKYSQQHSIAVIVCGVTSFIHKTLTGLAIYPILGSSFTPFENASFFFKKEN